jgi:hypothetical protein
MIDPQLSDEAPAVTARTLRQFAGLSFLVFGGLACWQGLARHRVWPTVLLAGAAIGLGSIGLLRPERIRPIYTALTKLTYPIGHVVSLVVLGALFYGVFAPLGLFFRLIRRDALDIRLPERPSHWTAKEAVTDFRRYTRQS